VQGRSAAGVRQLLRDVRALGEADAFAIVVEAVPAVVGAAITDTAGVPTLGMGAGPHCSGQVLLWHDLFGLYHGASPKFARRYGEAGALFAEGLKGFAGDIRAAFPGRGTHLRVARGRAPRRRTRGGRVHKRFTAHRIEGMQRDE